MANDDEKTVVEQGDKKEASEGEGKKKPGGKNMIMLGGIGVGAIVIGLALALFVVKPMMSSDSSETDATEEVSTDDGHGEKKEHKPKKKHKEESSDHGGGHGEEGAVESLVYMVSDIVVNPAGTGGSRFLSVSFGFELESSYMMSQFEAKEPIIRDALITIMSSKTVAHLTDPRQKEIIRLLIKRKVSRIMETDELAGVYYTDFVLQ
ncbi:MAG: flagellar basal body-associated FliL family protein [candidate division Zixibacteria bacterium]|nr:flagellar basal body-associated FliL family protein [candidate division Zixibacteria bacterium]